MQQEPRHPLELARDHLDDATPLLTGDPMTAAATMIQESGDREAIAGLSDADLLRRAAREVLIAVAAIARAMMVKATLAATRPAEIGILMRALAECLQAATAVLARQDEKGAG